MRLLLLLVVLIALWAAGVVDLGGLPWGDPDFQASAALVLVYLAWSVIEGRTGGGADSSLPSLVLYAVLLVSAVDGMLLFLSSFSEPLAARWAGVALLAAGSVMRVVAIRSRGRTLLRSGRVMQLLGIPAGLGSIAGLALAATVGILGSIGEELPRPPAAQGEGETAG